ncbi:hypothetical protein BE20_35335 [Sorangium cellulosum]|nr:hypothetical protein BE20_35335 [Sorangium cellulosum]
MAIPAKPPETARSNQRICLMALRRTNRPSASSFPSRYPWLRSQPSSRAKISSALWKREAGSRSRQPMTIATSSLSIFGRSSRRSAAGCVVMLRKSS